MADINLTRHSFHGDWNYNDFTSSKKSRSKTN
jgi:hypothetical protein